MRSTNQLVGSFPLRLVILISGLLANVTAADAQWNLSVGAIGGGSLTTDFRMETIPAQGNSPYMTFSSTSRDYLAGALVRGNTTPALVRRTRWIVPAS